MSHRKSLHVISTSSQWGKRTHESLGAGKTHWVAERLQLFGPQFAPSGDEEGESADLLRKFLSADTTDVPSGAFVAARAIYLRRQANAILEELVKQGRPHNLRRVQQMDELLIPVIHLRGDFELPQDAIYDVYLETDRRAALAQLAQAFGRAHCGLRNLVIEFHEPTQPDDDEDCARDQFEMDPKLLSGLARAEHLSAVQMTPSSWSLEFEARILDAIGRNPNVRQLTMSKLHVEWGRLFPSLRAVLTRGSIKEFSVHLTQEASVPKLFAAIDTGAQLEIVKISRGWSYSAEDMQIGTWNTALLRLARQHPPHTRLTLILPRPVVLKLGSPTKEALREAGIELFASADK